MKIFLSTLVLLTIVVALPTPSEQSSLVSVWLIMKEKVNWNLHQLKNFLLRKKVKSHDELALIEKLPDDLLLCVGKFLPLKDYHRFSTCSEILRESILYKDYKDMIEFLSTMRDRNGFSEDFSLKLLDNVVPMRLSKVPDELCYLSNYFSISFKMIESLKEFQNRFPKSKATIIYDPHILDENEVQNLTSFLQSGGKIHEFNFDLFESYFAFPELIPQVLQSGARKVFLKIMCEDMDYLDLIGKYITTSSAKQLKELNIFVSERPHADHNIDEQWSKFFQVLPQSKIEVLKIEQYATIRKDLLVHLAESLPLNIRTFKMGFFNINIQSLGSIFKTLAVKTNLKHLGLRDIKFRSSEYTLKNLRLLA
ncbi:hypothetical protein ROZALSC1DRAFT_25772, partial [Rozella allomycis CSF55]